MATHQLMVGKLILTFGEAGVLLNVATESSPRRHYKLSPPMLEIDGGIVKDFRFEGCSKPRRLRHGGQEWSIHFTAKGAAPIQLELQLRGFDGSPFIRFRYRVHSERPARLTKTDGRDSLRYFELSQWPKSEKLTQIQLGHFDPTVHCYVPLELQYDWSELYEHQNLTGPIVILNDAKQTLLLAYEHGTDQPNSFLQFEIGVEKPAINLQAVKGNYYDGYPLDSKSGFESIWFELGLIDGGYDDILPCYRQFLLAEISENSESRKPYIFYNTWNYQERQRYYNGRPYLESMHLKHILAEIEVAHRLGIDVYVIDTGWYNKTGDWLVNLQRFPDGLQQVRAKLDEYGMKLGLWFNPIVAARTSAVMKSHPEYVITQNGTPWDFGEVWETEQSFAICLASGYVPHYVQTMIRLRDKLGVTYFKWDGISQYGCDSPKHDHGNESHTPEERQDCYAFEMGRRMIQIVEEVSAQRPDVIVDFDITEGQRFMGLGFLSVGKYFLVNNGPYYHDFDIPSRIKIEPNTINVFFHPGAARPRICRQGVKYDGIIPSILFLTHYLPDPPALSQRNSLASMLLGGNGIWGDLLSMSDEDICLLSSGIGDYKLVADAVTRAYPRVMGEIGTSPEIYEKLDAESGLGMVVLFTVNKARIVHVTEPISSGKLLEVKGADHWERLPDGRVKLELELAANEARVVFFLGE